MQRSPSCRSRRELSNEYLLAKIGVDTTENEPHKVCQQLAKLKIRNIRINIGPKLRESAVCNAQSCGVEDFVDCMWGPWGAWGECSMGALVDGDCLDCPDCCNGVKMRERTIKTPAECGGMPCNGSDKEIEACVKKFVNLENAK